MKALFWFLLGVECLLLLWGFRMPGGDLPFLFAGAAWVFIALSWVVVRILARVILKLMKRPNVVPVFAGWRTWMLCAGVILVIFGGGVLGVPFRLAFAVSRPQFEELVEAYGKGQPTKGDVWAGVFPIAGVESMEGGYQFTFRKDEFPWGRRGVYYSVTGERMENSYFDGQKRMGPKWFSWHYAGW